MPIWMQAGLWGLFAGGALVLGAAIGYRVRLSGRVIASIMAFGAGVLISALAFEFMGEAYKQGGLGAAAFGFASGAVVYSAANWLLSLYGAKHRKRSGGLQPSENGAEGSGAAIAVGALLDGIPESIAIGLGMLAGTGVSMVTVTATGVAAGAVLAMIVDTMIPEAFERTHNLAGLITSAGFLCAFPLSMLET